MNNKKQFNYDGKYSKKYYNVAFEGNRNFNKDASFLETKKHINKNSVICEFGCGDGSKLIHYKNLVKEIYGFDLSGKAIRKAKKMIPNGKFYVSDNAKIFKDNMFDVTLSFYFLEHVENPRKFINEMLRVTKKGGYVMGLCPNYGSPLVPAPKVILDKGILGRIIVVLKRISEYREKYKNNFFTNIKPILDREWDVDFDTVSEVYLEKLVEEYADKVIFASSFWEAKPLIYLPFAFLGFIGIKPVTYWGFRCFFVLKK